MLETPTLVKAALNALEGQSGPSHEDLCHWYELMHLGRLLDGTGDARVAPCQETCHARCEHPAG